MASSFSSDERREHFAYCVQIFGGTTAFSRRLGIDERAIRRFINGERPLGDGLLEDTAKALRVLVAEATAAEREIFAALSAEQKGPS
ncbi:MAG: helix-turn-helix transcriptional regulator [Sphingobium sp.]